MREEKSQEHYDASKQFMPGGVNSPVRSCLSVNRIPRFIKSGKGAYITDVDGNTYIDYVESWGPGILGHAFPKVIEAVTSAAQNGLSFGAPTEAELNLAKLVNSLMPHVEMLRLVNSGTEAVMSAVRLARGFTGLDKILKFKGCYHGHSDGLLVKAGSAALTTAVPDSAGVPKSYTNDTLVADYNSEESVTEIFKANPGKIAAVLVEPVAANMGVVPPKEGFLKFLREITSENGALLIFDEVITGFRLALGGASEYYDIKPDLVTLGKIIGGGMPVGAYGGRRDIMAKVTPLGPVYQAGTLSGNPIGTAAGIATLSYIKEHPDLYKELDKKAKKLTQGYKEYLGDLVQVNQVGSIMSVFFTSKAVNDYSGAVSSDLSLYSKYYSFMLEHGIYVAPSQFEAMFISLAHSDADIDKTLEVIKAFAKEIA